MHRFTANALLLGSAVIWGVAFLFQKSAMDHIGPLLFVGVRSVLAALVLVPFVLLERRSLAAVAGGDVAFWRMAVVVGPVFFLAAWLQQWGIVTASVTNSGFLTALYVVLTPFIAWALMRRRPTGIVWVAAVLSFAGTWLLGGGGLTAFGTGDMLVTASAAFWALHVVLLGLAAPLGRPILLTTIQFAVVGCLGLAGALVFEPIDLGAVRRVAVEIAFVGILSSALTFTILTIAMRYTAPTEAAVLVSMETIFAALAAYLWMGERLTAVSSIGAAMIFAAVLLVQFSPAEPVRQTVSP